MYANLLTAIRFVLGIIMIIFAYQNKVWLFLGYYLLALITDIFDGFVARKFKEVSNFGQKFDILADNFIVLCQVISLYFLSKESLFKYWFLFLALVFYFGIIQLIAYIKTKKMIFMRTYAANAAAVLFPFVILSLIFFDSEPAVYFYIILMIYALTEKLFLHFGGKKKKTFLKEKSVVLFLVIVLLVSILIFFVPLFRKPTVCFEDGFCIEVEIRDTPNERALGLMYKESLAEDEGMLFVFEKPDKYTFWMKNMKISIDMIFINEDKEIVHIVHNATPCISENCELYPTPVAAKYVVETVAGVSEKHTLEMGQGVSLDILT